MSTGWLLVSAVLLILAACGPPPRPAAVRTPATSVVPAPLVPGGATPTRPALGPAGSPTAAPAGAMGAAGPVMHPTVPRLAVTPSPAPTAGR
jgi:hypothetical protein